MNASDIHSEEIRKRFGELVKYYRREVFGWKQEQLASRAGLGIHTIQDIENAQKKHLDEYTVTKLADIFELVGTAKDSFFVTAGLAIAPPVTPPINMEAFASSFFKGMRYPAVIFDIFCDLQFMNSYMLSVLGLSLEKMPGEFFRSTLGANMMRLFFDPSLGMRGLYRQHWRSHITINVYLFQEMSRPVIYEKRYREVIQELQQFEEFDTVWKEATSLVAEAIPAVSTILYSPHYGKVTFKHIEYLMPAPLEQRYNAIFYLPDDDETEEVFRAIRREDKDAKVYHFTRNDRRGFTEFIPR